MASESVSQASPAAALPLAGLGFGAATAEPVVEDAVAARRACELADEERTLIRQRLRWVVSLHWTAGLLLYGVILVYWVLGPMPGKLAQITAVMLVVCIYIGMAEMAIRRWRRQRRMPAARFFSLTMNGLGAADTVALVIGAHFGGGADAPALHFSIIPLVVFGAFLPRRDVYLHATFVTLLLALVFVGQHSGWLAHQCPPIPGWQCAIDSVPHALARYLSVTFLAFLVAYLASFVGTSLRTQEARARREAQERALLAAMRARFVMQASHEFRTPLTVILGAAESLSRYRSRMTPSQQQERLDRIRESVGGMTNLLEEVLTLGRADSSGALCNRRPVLLDELCAEVVEEVRLTAGPSHRLSYTSHALGGAVMADPGLLRRALYNLLSNAVKYSPAGGTVALAARRQGEHVTLRVSDEGIGIAKADLASLFEPFHRGENVGDIPGFGLGLAIARRAVTLHGGTLEVESEPGRGTTFVVTIPAGDALAADSPAGSDTWDRALGAPVDPLAREA